MVDEKKLLEHFAKVLNVEVPPDPIKEDMPVSQTPVLKKSFKDVVRDKRKKIKSVVEKIIEQEVKVPITLFDLIKEEMSRTVPNTVDEPPPAMNEERRPKTLQEHLAVTKPIKI